MIIFDKIFIDKIQTNKIWSSNTIIFQIFQRNNFVDLPLILTHLKLILFLYHCEKYFNSPNFLVWKFCGKAQFPHSFGHFTYAFPRNFHTKKLGEMTVFFAVHRTQPVHLRIMILNRINAQLMKLFFKYFLSKFEESRSSLWASSHLLKKPSMEFLFSLQWLMKYIFS